MKSRDSLDWRRLGMFGFVVLIVVALISLFLTLLFWILPLTESPHLWNLAPEEGAAVTSAQLQARAIVIQVIGGVFLAGTLAFTIWNLRLAQENARLAQEELRVGREGQITERFTRATDQLGSDKLATRLGGIYTLERIARDSDRDHSPVIEILIAYLRERAPNPDERIEDLLERPIALDVQAAITVIGRRKPEMIPLESTRIQLSDHGPPWAVGIPVPMGKAHLSGAHLERAVLINACLKNADLSYAHLEGASLGGAHLEEAMLFYAHLEGASLFLACLEGASLFSAHLEGAYLSNVKGLTQKQIDGTFMDENTVLPADLGPDGQPYRRSTRTLGT